MAPKKKSVAAVAVAPTHQNNDDDVPLPVSNHQQQSSSAPLPSMKIPPNRTAASLLFGSSTSSSTENERPHQSPKKQQPSATSFDSLKLQLASLPKIDEVVTSPSNSNGQLQAKNSFLEQLSASSSRFSFEQTFELCKSFVHTSHAALSSNSFLFVLSILASHNDGNEEKMMRSVAALVTVVVPRSGVGENTQQTQQIPLHLRGSLFDAARQVLLSSSSSSTQKSSSTTTTTSRIFKACLQVLIAAVEAGRHATVALMSSVIDGISCTCTHDIQPQSLLRDAAQLLTALGKFATVGAPRLRGLVSAWNAPALPAKKEAMVVKGGPFKINVAPEFEVKHVTVKL